MKQTYPAPVHRLSPAERRRLRRDVGIRLAYLVVGFTPIATLALSLVEVVPLHVAAPVSITTAVLLGLGLAIANPDYRRPVLRGLAGGTAAVLIYDCTRLPFVMLAGWPDFIPNIGAWLLDDPDAHWSIGYLWRYLGNGAGMGLAFAMNVPRTRRWIDPRRAGVVFGVAIWTGLLITLAIAPGGEEKMFAPTPGALSLTLVGHLVYGGILGLHSAQTAPDLAGSPSAR